MSIIPPPKLVQPTIDCAKIIHIGGDEVIANRSP